MLTSRMAKAAERVSSACEVLLYKNLFIISPVQPSNTVIPNSSAREKSTLVRSSGNIDTDFPGFFILDNQCYLTDECQKHSATI